MLRHHQADTAQVSTFQKIGSGHNIVVLIDLGLVNNYMDKMKGEGVKNICFCPNSGYKNCPRNGVGGSKNGKFLST